MEEGRQRSRPSFPFPEPTQAASEGLLVTGVHFLEEAVEVRTSVRS